MPDIRVASYNIRHAQGLDGKININRIAQTLARSGAHLIGLQEVDKYLPRSNFINQAKMIGRLLGGNWVYGPNEKWGVAEYGTAVISQWPVIRYSNHHLTSRGEQRGLLEVEIDLYHRPVSFFCTHLGLNKEERQQQVQEILKIIDRTHNPVILVGDFNDDKSSKEFYMLNNYLREATNIGGGFNTFPANQPEEQIDFVFVSTHWQVLSSFSIISDASDHLPVFVDLRLANKNKRTGS